MIFFKILRVLTTNECNFNCTFCHNEGQAKNEGSLFLQFSAFMNIISALKKFPIKEIQFSGGEPFINKETIKMIEWTNKHTDYEIGCATNLSLLNDEIILRLSKTRISLNIQFPAFQSDKYKKTTKFQDTEILYTNLNKLKKHKIPFTLNYVWQKEDVNILSEMIDFCLTNNFNIKILPNINKKTLKQNDFYKLSNDLLVQKFGIGINSNNGAIKWIINGTKIKYINTPCFEKKFDACKNYAELRLNPDLSLQNCILKKGNIKILESELIDEKIIQSKLMKSWNSFTNC